MPQLTETTIDTYDAIVVGAGPAGSRTARDLARSGLQVAILEENRTVGMPCHCSGLVTPRTLELADAGDDLILNTLRGAVIHLASGQSVRLGGDRVHAHAIDRVELDRRLAQQATDAGAELLTSTQFQAFRLVGEARGSRERPANGSVVASVVREGTATELSARVLIGADGALSRVARQIRGSGPTGTVAGLGGHADYDANPHTDHVEIFLDPHAAPGWFGWTIPLGDGTSRVGTGSANGVKPIESFQRLRDRFPETFGTATVMSRSGGTIALWQPTPLVADRVVLVGDAARQVKPTSGGGIYAALHAAELAASTITRALGQSDLSAKKLGEYGKRWNRSLGREFRRQHDLRRAFTRLSEPQMRRVIEALGTSALRRHVESTADIDFPSRAAMAVARRSPALALMLLATPRFPTAWLRRAA